MAIRIAARKNTTASPQAGRLTVFSFVLLPVLLRTQRQHFQVHHRQPGLRHRQTLARRTEALLQENPAATKDMVAERLHISGRHLNRLLAEDGTSFKLLQDTVRRRLAEAALQAADSRMADIAERLGFSDESAFAKAFRRWTGLSPGQFRERRQA